MAAATGRKSLIFKKFFIGLSSRRFTSIFVTKAKILHSGERPIDKPSQAKKFSLPNTSITSRTLCTKQQDAKFVQDLKSSPPPAIWLGFSGAIPFAGLAGLSMVTPEYLDIILTAQCGYGACILSFLGAIHWGYALSKDTHLKPNWGTLGYSVSPSLVAWSALLIKPQYGLVTIAIGLLYALSKDLGTPSFPGWY